MAVELAERAGDQIVGAGSMRVLVAYGDEYRAYREAIARTIQCLRPSAQVTITRPEALPAQVSRLNPRVVICASKAEGVPAQKTTWITVPTEAGAPGSISCGGSSREVGNISLIQLLTVLDEAGLA